MKFVGTERGLETRIVPAEGYRLLTIRSAGITGKSLQGRLKGGALIPVSLWQSLRLIGRHRPGLVIGVGGYASGPVLAAAVIRRVPTLIHEQNYVPGTTNRWIAPWVTQVVVTFPETIALLKGRGVTLGNPVRNEFTEVTRWSAFSGVRSLLIFGGSQGARAINDAVVAALPRLAGMRAELRVTHQTGPADLDRVTRAWREAGFGPERVEVRAFISGMARAFEEADLVVCRAGATTVAELTAAGRASLLVPFAQAAHDHQTWNARKLEATGAATLIPQKELTGDRLGDEVMRLFQEPALLERMSVESRRLGRPDAGARIAELCARLLAGGSSEGGRRESS